MSKYVTREALRSILSPLAKRPEVFVEAGTFQARVTQIALEYFPEIHTIEASEKLYYAAKEVLLRTGVHCYLGDARTVVRDLAAKLTEPVVWYLDANWWPYPDVHEDCPVLDLVKALSGRPAGDVIIVDEAHAFGSSRPGWAAVTAEAISELLGKRDVVLMYNCAVVYL